MNYLAAALRLERAPIFEVTQMSSYKMEIFTEFCELYFKFDEEYFNSL